MSDIESILAAHQNARQVESELCTMERCDTERQCSGPGGVVLIVKAKIITGLGRATSTYPPQPTENVERCSVASKV